MHVPIFFCLQRKGRVLQQSFVKLLFHFTVQRLSCSEGEDMVAKPSLGETILIPCVRQ